MKGWIKIKRFITVLALVLSFAMLISGCASEPEASSSAQVSSTAQSSSQATSDSTAEATESASESAQPTSSAVEPVIDEDGTYHFNVGGEMYEGRLLTDFSVGTVNLDASFGSYEFADGILTAYTGGMLADSYENYEGDDLASADYSQVTYFGVRLINNQGGDILFGLQGGYEETHFFIGQEGDAVLLAYDDGTLYSAGAAQSSGRWCVTVPAGFSGHVLIPASRIYNSPNMDEGEAWTTSRPILEKLGFHVAGSGAEPVDITGMLLYDGELPQASEMPGN